MYYTIHTANKSADQTCAHAQATLHICCSHMASTGFLMTWLSYKTFEMCCNLSEPILHKRQNKNPVYLFEIQNFANTQPRILVYACKNSFCNNKSFGRIQYTRFAHSRSKPFGSCLYSPNSEVCSLIAKKQATKWHIFSLIH